MRLTWLRIHTGEDETNLPLFMKLLIKLRSYNPEARRRSPRLQQAMRPGCSPGEMLFEHCYLYYTRSRTNQTCRGADSRTGGREPPGLARRARTFAFLGRQACAPDRSEE